MRINRPLISADNKRRQESKRRGTVIILVCIMLGIVFGIAAFTIDFGLLNVTKGQIQNAADSAAHAAMQELVQGVGPGATVTPHTASTNAAEKAKAMVAAFRSAEVSSTQLSIERDVRFGRRSWNATSGQWVKDWGVTPYNMVEVSVRRTQSSGAPVPAIFAKLLGVTSFDVEAKSVASVAPSTGFTLPEGSTSTIDLLPIALDLTTWNNLVTQINSGTSSGFQDQHKYSFSTGGVTVSTDSIPEVNIYPDGNSSLPAGNRGTVDIGSSGNSTNDLKRQIEFGISSSDMSYFPNRELKFNSQGILYLNGDTGISAGIEAALKSIIGQVRAIPIFITVSGPGNNAEYAIVKFVGVRVMAVKLTGGPTQRYLRVQPAPYSTRFSTRGNSVVAVDSILSQPLLVE